MRKPDSNALSIPPTIKPGPSPEASRAETSKAEVVVLPWVPATTKGILSSRNRRDRASGKERWGMPLETTYMASGLSARITFPIITRSGSG